MNIKEKIKHTQKTLNSLYKDLKQERSTKAFPCIWCSKRHRIKDCNAIQTYYYNENTGSPNGGFWCESEIFITCPKTKKHNRVLLGNTELDREFRYLYAELFKGVQEQRKRGCYGDYYEDWKNNEYFQKNLKHFDLVKK